jgi:hypothetical protein
MTSGLVLLARYSVYIRTASQTLSFGYQNNFGNDRPRRPISAVFARGRFSQQPRPTCLQHTRMRKLMQYHLPRGLIGLEITEQEYLASMPSANVMVHCASCAAN